MSIVENFSPKAIFNNFKNATTDSIKAFSGNAPGKFWGTIGKALGEAAKGIGKVAVYSIAASTVVSTLGVSAGIIGGAIAGAYYGEDIKDLPQLFMSSFEKPNKAPLTEKSTAEDKTPLQSLLDKVKAGTAKVEDYTTAGITRVDSDRILQSINSQVKNDNNLNAINSIQARINQIIDFFKIDDNIPTATPYMFNALDDQLTNINESNIVKARDLFTKAKEQARSKNISFEITTDLFDALKNLPPKPVAL